MNKEVEKEFFEWKDEIEGKFNSLSLKISNPEWLDVLILDLMKPQIAELKEEVKILGTIREGLRVLSLCTYNLHQAILTNTSLGKLTIGKALFKLYVKLDPKQTEKKERCEFCNGAGIFEKDGYETIDCVHCEGTGIAKASGGSEIKDLCTLKEQEQCDNEGSMDCLKGNSNGERTIKGTCIHGKRELEKLPGPPNYKCLKCGSINNSLDFNQDYDGNLACPVCGSIYFKAPKLKEAGLENYDTVSELLEAHPTIKLPEPCKWIAICEKYDPESLLCNETPEGRDLHKADPEKGLYTLHLNGDEFDFKRTTHPFTEYNNMVHRGIGMKLMPYNTEKELIEEFLEHWRHISAYVDNDGTDCWEKVNEEYKGRLKK